MSLEEELKQSSFQSEYHKGLVNIMYTHNVIISRINDFFKGHQITRQQYNVLRILRGQHPKPATISLIKERMLDKMSDASRIVDRLIKKHLITREVNPGDKRAVALKISRKGLELLTKTDKDVMDFDDFLNSLNRKEIKLLNQLLDKIRE